MASSRRCPVAIVSGRDLADVRNLVQLDTVFYAGSHGFDISGPEGLQMQHQQGADFLPILDQAEALLQQKLKTIPAAFIERKKFSIAVHFRSVAPRHAEQIESVMDAVLASQPQLRKGWGKKVFELQPRIDWDKGKAVRWLLAALGLNTSDVLPLYIGDDVTDEDAFRTLAERGITIVVSETPRRSAARYVMQNTAQVQTFLQGLAIALSA